MTSLPEVSSVLPLTPAQQGLLLHSVADIAAGVYVNQVVITLHGDLDPVLLRQCWQQVVRRHDILRTAFLWEGLDEPLQAVRADVELPWAERDWRGLTAQGLDDELAAYLAADREEPFVLARAPLMRLVLVRTAARQWSLIWTHHHILLDGWAMSLVLDEVFRRYHGNESLVPECPPYSEYVDWVYEQDIDESDRFWRERLTGHTGGTPLPAARPVRHEQPGFGSVISRVSPEELTALRGFARRHRLTLGTIVHGMWAILLSRHASRRDVLFGSVVSGRPAELPGSDRMIGLLSNTLAVPVTVDETAEVVSWLTALQSQLAEARDYEHSSLSRAARMAGVAGAANLFETIVAWENYPDSSLDGDGDIEITSMQFVERPHYPAALSASVTDEQLSLRLHADWQWYEQPAAASLVEQLRALLVDLADGHQRRVGELVMTPPDELNRVVDTTSEPPGRSIMDIFDDQVRSGPRNPAVVHATTELTYQDLADRVNRLAHHLRTVGVGPEVPVAVCVHPSVELVVAWLAVIRAGGMVMSIDPRAPRARIAALLTMSGSRIALTTGTPPVTVDVAIALDNEVTAATCPVDPPPFPEPNPDNGVHLVYVADTAGPRLEVLTHRSVIHRPQRQSPSGPGAVAAEFYQSLLTGACLVVSDGPLPVPVRGSATDSLRCRLLDEELNPVPIGVPGRLYTAGPALPRGYWGKPARTACHFVPDPDGPPGSRTLRTTQSGRWTPTGDLDLAGTGPVSPAVESTGTADPGFVAPRDETERVLAEIWAEVLKVELVGVHDNFFELGGDSIMSLLVVSRAARAGLRVTARQFLDHQTVAGLAAAAEHVQPPAAIRTGTATGQVALTPVQHWFFDQEFAYPGHWNLSVALAVTAPVDATGLAESLRPVVEAMIARHDALRTQFRRHDSRWSAEVVSVDEAVRDDLVTVISVADRPDWDQAFSEAAATAQMFDLGRAPLLHAVIVDGGRADRLRLLMIAHHLVVDGVSWRILLQDLEIGYSQVAGGQPVRLPAATTSQGAWAEALSALAHSPDFVGELDRWSRASAAGQDTPPTVVEADVRHVHTSLGTLDTERLLREVPRAYHTYIDDVLLAAVGLALAHRSGQRELVLTLESHGREEDLVNNCDLSGTVGWLTAIAPVRFELPAADEDPGRWLTSIKEQVRAVPRRGFGYGLLRYLNPVTGERLATAPQPAISFNNMGQFEAGDDTGELKLRPAPEQQPAAHHPGNRRVHALDINAIIVDGRLRLTFSHDVAHQGASAVRDLAEDTMTQLRRLITHCCARSATVHTPSDFPESGLDQRQLDQLMADL